MHDPILDLNGEHAKGLGNTQLATIATFVAYTPHRRHLKISGGGTRPPPARQRQRHTHPACVPVPRLNRSEGEEARYTFPFLFFLPSSSARARTRASPRLRLLGTDLR
ncbi:hypothetical protein D9615_010476 [Tricholomella constricta]|uniref:Uncharacterized protein n=1 Tax=Tricholomella constricta TaxID=117010 RepID=A0A8H5GN99_9AGAR|nr:hypothetical protein D9615_010476 [Tricholomella constricta]